MVSIEPSSASASASIECAESQVVVAPPALLGLDCFYTKYVNAHGIPIVSSQVVPDEALFVVKDTVIHMLSKRPDLRQKLIDNCVRVAVIGEKQFATDIPEHSDLKDAYPAIDWNSRTRGVGATHSRRAASCAQENLLGYPRDRYRGENILVHEFAHTIHNMALAEVDCSFSHRLESAFVSPREKNLWADTYAISNAEEYWSTGAQHWFDASQSVPVAGIHNSVHTRAALRDYDPGLYALLAEVFPDDNWRPQTSRR